MLNLDQIDTISEVLILNNVRHQHQQTTGVIQRFYNQHHTSFVDLCYCVTDVLFEIVCLFVGLKLVFYGANSLAKQQREMTKQACERTM